MAGKRVSLYKFTATSELLTLTSHGAVRSIAAADAMKLPTVVQAVFNGLRQKAADVGASIANPLEKADAIMATFERLCDGGAWNVGREAAGPDFNERLLAAALGLAKPELDENDVAEKVRAMPEKVRAALLASTQLKMYVDEAREGLLADVDTAGTLAEFGL